MAGVGDPESAWAGRVTPGLIAAFEAGRSRLAPAGLTVDLLQVRWRERPGVPWMDPVCLRWLTRILGARRQPGLPATVRVTVRVTEGADGRPEVGLVTRPGLAADYRLQPRNTDPSLRSSSYAFRESHQRTASASRALRSG